MNVLLIILGVILTIGAIVVVAPFHLRVFFSNTDGKTVFSVRVTWLVAVVEHDSSGDGPVLKVLCFSWGRQQPSEPEKQVAAITPVTPVVPSPALSVDNSEPVRVVAAPAPVVQKSAPVVRETPSPRTTPAESTPDASYQAPAGHNRVRDKKPGPAERVRKMIATARSGWKRLNGHIAVSFIRDRTWRGKVLRWLKAFAGGMLSTAQIDRIALDVTFGGEEPDEVGRNWGYVMGVYHALSTGKKRRITLNLKPVFAPHALEATVRAVFSTSIIRLIAPAVIALFTFPYLSTLLVYLRHRRKMRVQAAAGG